MTMRRGSLKVNGSTHQTIIPKSFSMSKMQAVTNVESHTGVG